MARALFMFGLSVTGTPTVELTQCNPGWWCNPPVPYTAATLNAAINAAGAAATATLGVNTAVWAAVFLNVPSIGRVGEYGTFVGHPTETTTTVKAAFGTLPSGCTLGVSVLSRDEAIGVGVMSNQWVALAGWFNGAPVTLGSSELGFLSISVRSDQPVLVSKIVNGAYHIYSDAVFLAQGFSDISGLPAYLSPPPAGITGIANLLTEQGFRDIVLAAGGPDLYASPGFDANLVMYLDPYVPDPLVMSVAVTVADVFHNRVTRLLASEGVSSFTMCGSLLEVAGMNIWVVLRTRLLALGVPVPFAICLNGVATEATRVLEGAHALEYAPHRP